LCLVFYILLSFSADFQSAILGAFSKTLLFQGLSAFFEVYIFLNFVIMQDFMQAQDIVVV